MKKILLFLSLLLAFNYALAVDNKFTGAVSNNWNVNGNWSQGTIPTSTDTYVTRLDATSPNCVLNATANCNAFDMTGYAATLSGASSLAVYGNCTFGGTITATGPFQFGANGTWTSNGITWPGNYTPTVGPTTITLADNATIGGNYTHTAGGGAQVFNGNTLNVKGGWTQSAGRTVAGTTLINFNGTAGTSTLNAGASVSNSVTFNSSNTLSITNWNQAGGTLTYTAGTISGSGALTFSGACTINTSSMTWPGNLTFASTGTVTLTSDINAAGSLNASVSGTATVNGVFNINCAGINTTANCNFTGTVSIVINGTGTLQNASATGNFQVNITINTAGTSTIGTALRIGGTATLTYVAGTVDATTNNSTLTLQGSVTMNTVGISWYNITVTGTNTYTINSLLTATGTLTFSTTATKQFLGTAGWTAANVVCDASTGTPVIIFKSGNTYTITNSASCANTTYSIPMVWQSSVGGSQAIITFDPAATQDLNRLSATDINSSLGAPVWSYKGTLSNATNWNNLPTQPITISTSN